MDHAERAEYMYIASGKALTVAELEAHGIVRPDEGEPDPSTNE
jgi:hypothetical protein